MIGDKAIHLCHAYLGGDVPVSKPKTACEWHVIICRNVAWEYQVIGRAGNRAMGAECVAERYQELENAALRAAFREIANRGVS